MSERSERMVSCTLKSRFHIPSIHSASMPMAASAVNGAGISASDRYAALAELDTIFSTTTPAPPANPATIDWTGNSPTPTAPAAVAAANVAPNAGAAAAAASIGAAGEKESVRK